MRGIFILQNIFLHIFYIFAYNEVIIDYIINLVI